MAINRFKELVNSGIAAPKYDTRFANYENNLYHSLNEVTRQYNAVWGALTDTNMRFDQDTKEYIITGSFVRKKAFLEMMDRTHFDTTCFNTSFRGTGINTMNDFFTAYNLRGEFAMFNGEFAFILKEAYDEITAVLNGAYGEEIGDLRCIGCGCYCGDCACESLLDKRARDINYIYAEQPAMKKIGAKTLREALEALNLTYYTCSGKSYFEKCENLSNKISNIRENYSFDNTGIIYLSESTVAPVKLFENYIRYISEKRQELLSIVNMIAHSNIAISEKNNMIATALFPFADIVAEKNGNASIKGIGTLNEDGIRFLNGNNFAVDFGKLDSFVELSKNLTFFESA